MLLLFTPLVENHSSVLVDYDMLFASSRVILARNNNQVSRVALTVSTPTVLNLNLHFGVLELRVSPLLDYASFLDLVKRIIDSPEAFVFKPTSLCGFKVSLLTELLAAPIGIAGEKPD